MKFPWQRKVINPKVKFEFTTLHRTSSYLSMAYTNTLKVLFTFDFEVNLG